MPELITGRLRQLLERDGADQIKGEDLDEFLKDPGRWRNPMPSMTQASAGPTTLFGQLQEIGLKPEDLVVRPGDEGMLWAVASVLLRSRRFTSPEKQAELLLALNEVVWQDAAITKEAAVKAGDPPQCSAPNDNGLYCVTLVYDTGDALQTLERNWAACVQVHGVSRTWKWDGFHFTPQGVRARKGALARPKGFRWVVAELGRQFLGKRVQDTRLILDRKKAMGMGQELPLLAAIHRPWALCMDGQEVPFVDAPDLEVAYAGGAFHYAPCLAFYRGLRQVRLDAKRVADDNPSCGSGSLQ